MLPGPGDLCLNDFTFLAWTGQTRHDFQRYRYHPAWFFTAVPIMIVPTPGNPHLSWFCMFAVNGPNKTCFSTIPLPSGIVFHGGSDFNGPRAWEATFSTSLHVWHERTKQGMIFNDTDAIRHSCWRRFRFWRSQGLDLDFWVILRFCHERIK